jgi:hypothetical protein
MGGKYKGKHVAGNIKRQETAQDDAHDGDTTETEGDDFDARDRSADVDDPERAPEELEDRHTG